MPPVNPTPIQSKIKIDSSPPTFTSFDDPLLQKNSPPHGVLCTTIDDVLDDVPYLELVGSDALWTTPTILPGKELSMTLPGIDASPNQGKSRY